MSESDEPLYASYDANWRECRCPACGRTATAHAWVYPDPPPEPGDEPMGARQPLFEVFQHDGADDCEVFGGSA